MKQFVIAVVIVAALSGLCFLTWPSLQAQKKVMYPITLNELYIVTTKDNAVYEDAKINITQLGCFIIKPEGYIFIPIDKIKTITEVKNACKNSGSDGGDIQRFVKGR